MPADSKKRVVARWYRWQLQVTLVFRSPLARARSSYIKPAEEVYEACHWQHLKGDEMSVNPTKGKQLTNMRASGTG